jgi:SHS2 domain-containing protein
MKNYELIEHTADIGIRLKAKNLKELFKNTASAMFEVMAEKKSEVKSQKSEVKKIKIKQKAQDLEELFVNWLNELLSLSSAKGLIFSDFKINKLDKNNLEAEAFGEDIKNYKVNTEIKAATYHALKIEDKDDFWQAEVIFDV